VYEPSFEECLRAELENFEKKREELAKKYSGKFVTIYKGSVVAVGDTYDESASKAKEIIGENPCVTRKAVPKEQEEPFFIL